MASTAWRDSHWRSRWGTRLKVSVWITADWSIEVSYQNRYNLFPVQPRIFFRFINWCVAWFHWLLLFMYRHCVDLFQVASLHWYDFVLVNRHGWRLEEVSIELRLLKGWSRRGHYKENIWEWKWSTTNTRGFPITQTSRESICTATSNTMLLFSRRTRPYFGPQYENRKNDSRSFYLRQIYNRRPIITIAMRWTNLEVVGIVFIWAGKLEVILRATTLPRHPHKPLIPGLMANSGVEGNFYF